MKTLVIVAAAGLGLSASALAGDFHGYFNSQTPQTTMQQQQQSDIGAQPAQATAPGVDSGAMMNNQDLFEMNNNWHVSHSSR